MRRVAALILVAFTFLSSGLVTAQSDSNPVPFVYRIKIEGCAFNPLTRRQTGFRVQGLKGIVTALHGIVDCKTISAVADDGLEIFNDLTLQAVSIDRDTALLSSEELANLPADGLVAPLLSHAEIPRADLQVVGYPLGLDKQDIDRSILIRDIEMLDDVIPDTEESVGFIKRRSPDITIYVLNVQAQLLPGHSGSPLLDNNNQVVAVANGGLRGGTVGRSWAIPWSDINTNWQSIDDLSIISRFADLKAQDPDLALSFSSTYPHPLEDSAELRTVLGAITDEINRPISSAEVTLIFEDRYYINNTDRNGIYRFSFDSNAIEKMRELLVEVDGYESTRFTIFEQLPAIIRLKSIGLPKRPSLERGGYIRVTWPQGLKMYAAPRYDTFNTSLADGLVLRVIGGPEQENTLQWWQVQPILGTYEPGWVIPANATDVYVKSLPQVFVNDQIEIIGDRLSLQISVGINTGIISPIEQGEKLKVIEGPQEADGYLWYKLETPDGIQGWAKAFGERDFLKIVSPISSLTAAPTEFLTVTPTPSATSTLASTLSFTETSQVTPTDTKTWTPTETQTLALTPKKTNISTPTAILTSLASIHTPTPTPMQTPKANEEAPRVTNKTGENINLRSGPGLSYSVIGQLKPGESLIVNGRNPLFGVSDDENWWRVVLPDGQEGWVRRDIVEESGNFEEVLIINGYSSPTPTNISPLATPTKNIATLTLTNTLTPASIKPTTETPTPASIKPATETPTPASIEPIVETPTPASIEPIAETPTPASIGLK